MTQPLYIRIPDKLAETLQDDSIQTDETWQSVILRILCEHYEIEYVPPRRGRPALDTGENN